MHWIGPARSIPELLPQSFQLILKDRSFSHYNRFRRPIGKNKSSYGRKNGPHDSAEGSLADENISNKMAERNVTGNHIHRYDGSLRCTGPQIKVFAKQSNQIGSPLNKVVKQINPVGITEVISKKNETDHPNIENVDHWNDDKEEYVYPVMPTPAFMEPFSVDETPINIHDPDPTKPMNTEYLRSALQEIINGMNQKNDVIFTANSTIATNPNSDKMDSIVLAEIVKSKLLPYSAPQDQIELFDKSKELPIFDRKASEKIEQCENSPMNSNTEEPIYASGRGKESLCKQICKLPNVPMVSASACGSKPPSDPNRCQKKPDCKKAPEPCVPKQMKPCPQTEKPCVNKCSNPDPCNRMKSSEPAKHIHQDPCSKLGGDVCKNLSKLPPTQSKKGCTNTCQDPTNKPPCAQPTQPCQMASLTAIQTSKESLKKSATARSFAIYGHSQQSTTISNNWMFLHKRLMSMLTVNENIEAKGETHENCKMTKSAPCETDTKNLNKTKITEDPFSPSPLPAWTPLRSKLHKSQVKDAQYSSVFLSYAKDQIDSQSELKTNLVNATSDSKIELCEYKMKNEATRIPEEKSFAHQSMWNPSIIPIMASSNDSNTPIPCSQTKSSSGCGQSSPNKEKSSPFESKPAPCSQMEQKYKDPCGDRKRDSLCGEKKSSSPCGEQKPKSPCGEQKPKSPCGQESPKSPCGEQKPKSPCGQATPKSTCGEQKPKTPCGQETPKSPCGEQKPKSPYGQDIPKSPCGEKKPKSPCGQETSKSPCGEKKTKSPCGQETSKSPCGEKSPMSPCRGKKNVSAVNKEPNPCSSKDEKPNKCKSASTPTLCPLMLQFGFENQLELVIPQMTDYSIETEASDNIEPDKTSCFSTQKSLSTLKLCSHIHTSISETAIFPQMSMLHNVSIRRLNNLPSIKVRKARYQQNCIPPSYPYPPCVPRIGDLAKSKLSPDPFSPSSPLAWNPPLMSPTRLKKFKCVC